MGSTSDFCNCNLITYLCYIAYSVTRDSVNIKTMNRRDHLKNKMINEVSKTEKNYYTSFTMVIIEVKLYS
jgi:hypothetical protein